MNVSSPISTERDGSREVLWDDGERVFCREWRRSADGKLNSFLIVKLTSEHPTPLSLDRLVHEYALRDELDGPWAVRPLELIREGSRTLLMLDDPAGAPLDEQLGAPMKLDRFLRRAIAIATALSQLHRRGLIHKDLKPANILVNASGEVRFTGFGIASRLSRERQQLQPPETIAGTLAYMAPEQTGRMNRSIDSRSDLYALGVTLYQMLTGSLPFIAVDPMEWVHCHIARRAVPPAERTKDIPGAVSAIIVKLLAKTAEERYQTAAGLQNDLQRCRAEWEARGQIEDFVLGQADTPDQLLIPEKLYGREREIDTLLASFDRVARNGTPELVLVSGYSGIGKSALIQELHKALVPTRGLFASGKFDQHKREMPYAALAEAFQDLVRGLLAKSDADLAPWREALREALGALGQLMVDLVPELQLVIGDQPPVPKASPPDAQRRFALLVRRFIGVFARPSHPLAIFLDDLQWLDMATLDLIEALLAGSDLQYLLLIGAYRQNEVGTNHPLTRKLVNIRDYGMPVQEIGLAPLTCGDVEQLVVDALRCERAHAAPLAQLMHEKTGGNPFFLIQFLHTLDDEELLVFDHDSAQWRWDLARIHAKAYTANIADLMVDKLSSLRNETRRVLLELACLGNGAEVTTLSRAHGTSEQQVHADLQQAVGLELVRLLDNSYSFVHDRVREAAYALQPDEGKRAALHLRIGMAMAAHLTPDQTSTGLYVVANQLNRGITALTREAEREQILAVNLAAGRRARNATAYHAALAFLESASQLLGEKGHPRCTPTAFAVALLRAECEFLVGHLDVAEAQLLVLSQSCSNLQASADVTKLQAQLYTAAGQIERAVDVCLAFLRQVGIDWSPHPDRGQVDEDRQRLRRLAEELSDDRLHALPQMTDPAHRATMGVLADLVTPAFLTNRNLSDIMLLEATRLTLEHGICPESCYPLTATFGVLASNSADADHGFRLSRFGAALADKQPQSGLSGRALLVFGLHVMPWVRPIRSGRSFMQRGLGISLAAGDLAFAAYSHRGLLSVALFCGDPLSDVSMHAEQALAFTEASGIRLSTKFLVKQRDLALGLMGRDDEHSFAVPGKPHPSEVTEPLSGFFYYAAQIQLNVLAGRHDVALALAELADKLSWCVRAYSEFTEYRFYTGLAHASAYSASPPEDRDRYLSGLREQHRKLSIWSVRCPENFAAREALLAAEIARIEGRELDAEQLYEDSIRLAQEAGFVQIEAIAAERAARFYESRGIRTVVLSYIAHARDCYMRWGADAKVRQLDVMQPHLRRNDSVLNPTCTIGTSVEQLDLATVLKVSEAVSGEIVLEKLTDTLLRTAVEHAGAERGILLLPKGRELRIQAEATSDEGSITIDHRDLPSSSIGIAESIALYAARTQESVILDDASAHSAFARDPYVHRKNARSILCLPLVKQGRTVALLYLENNLAARVFTPARVAVLKFLASEAATSLDNARLYGELQERESRIRRLVDSNIIGIFIFDDVPDIVEANQSFLNTIGYDREDLEAGRLRWAELRPPEWYDRAARARAELKATGVVRPFENEFVRKDGSRVPVLTGGALFDGDDGRGVAFVLDLSERKRAETEASENEQRYREAQMELAHANRVAVMGQLTASIAHEVNQPTTAVVASAEAALRWLDRQPPELDAVRNALIRVVQNGIRASEVIGRIRDLVKKNPPKRDRFPINRIIHEAIEFTRTEAARNYVSVGIAFTDGLPDIVGDRVELQQVVVNLVLNAIEAIGETIEGKRELLIRTAHLESGAVVVAIMDSGPGLPPAGVDRIFEPFYSTKSGGLGIGLSICRSIIEAHGGRLWCSPNDPRGAVFQFTLPAPGEDSSG